MLLSHLHEPFLAVSVFRLNELFLQTTSSVKVVYGRRSLIYTGLIINHAEIMSEGKPMTVKERMAALARASSGDSSGGQRSRWIEVPNCKKS